MSKEIWMNVHEELVQEYLAEHPDADWTEAYERTTPAVDARYQDKFASMIDAAKDRT